MLTFAMFLLMQQAPAAAPPAPAPAPAAAKPPAPASAPAPPAPAAAPVLLPAGDLVQVKNVYILPMGSGFDQYLANQVSRKGVLHVVADPARADAILTDRLGKGFEAKLQELYPEPKPEPKPKAEKEAEEEDSSASFDVKNLTQDRQSSFGRGKGTIFLVDRASKSVIWSIYSKPKSTQADDLNDTAREVAGQLTSAIQKKAKQLQQAAK